ncbi:ribosomal RNA small subunit methyltransferase A [bacterium]|nr:ribosomal RNA small subunit methyltransferase A [bacterium]
MSIPGPNPTNPRRILEEIGFQPSKARGQNFLVSESTARKIAGSASGKFATAVEIGPGLGALTEALLAVAPEVHAIEIDRRLSAYLSERFGSEPSFHLIESDALDLNWRERFSGAPAPRVLFGNLPYSVGAPLIEKFFQNVDLFTEGVFCLQSEVADRLVSAGGRGMGPITLLAHRFSLRREKLFRIPPGAFYPRPKVTSTVIRLVPRPGVAWTPLDAEIPRRLFSGRRKKLSSVLPRRLLPAGLADKRIDELDVDTAAFLADRLREP